MGDAVYDFTRGYEAALRDASAVGAGSDEAVERFKDFMASLSAASIRERTHQVYAAEAYLNDNLNEVHGVDAIEAHLAASLEGLSAIRVDFHDTAHAGRDWYLRWSMSTTFRSLRGGAEVVTSGVSHLRFDTEGRVLVHRDFWDAATGIYEHIPVLGAGIRAVKRRITGR